VSVPRQIAETVALQDQKLAGKLLSSGPYVTAVIGRSGAMAARRVLDALAVTNTAAGPADPIFLGGALAPVGRLRERVARALQERGKEVDPRASWSDLVRAAARSPSQVLVFDDAHLIGEADHRFTTELSKGWHSAVGGGDTPRVVIITDDRRFVSQLQGKDSPFYDPLAALTEGASDTVTIEEVGGLAYDAMARACPRWPAADVVRGFAIFGGLPEVLGRIDPERSLGWNVSHQVLDVAGPLFDYPARAVAARFQKTGRYGAVLSALARGAQTWKEVGDDVPELESGSALGAYAKRLGDRGLLEVRESLDAGPRSRRRRYKLADPYDAFWFRFVAPLADRLMARQMTGVDAWERQIRPQLAPFVARMFPELARAYLARYAHRRVDSDARVVGGLWGEDYDFEAAATLRNGSVVYGHCAWVDHNLGLDALERAKRELRETRYGFGRERRTILLFMKEPPAPELERAALRDPHVEWVDATRMVHDARAHPTESSVS